MLAAGLWLAACGSPYPGQTLGQQVQSWMQSTSFASSLSSLRGDARHIDVLEGRHQPLALHTDCDVLVDDALSANQNLPAPDGTLTSVLAGAYASAVAAGRRCLSEAPLARVQAALAAASSGYVKAEARLDDLGVTASGLSSLRPVP